MKFKSLFLTIAATVATMAAVAQSGFSYQAVVRNSKGELVSNKNVGLRITLTDQEGKQNFYQEVQSVPTNAYGVLSTTIGAADTTVLKNLKWNDGVWMRVEIDAAGGTKYTDMGLTPIQAVPYALYAANGGKGAKGDKGDKGDPGEPGTGLTNRGAWSAGSYKAGEYVFAPSAANPAVNTMWIAQRDIDASTSAPTVGEDWVEFHAPKGDKGEQGEQGVGISSTSFNNDDHTLTITLTNGQTFTTQSLQGPQGLQGEQGPAGPQGNPGTGLTNRGAWNAANTYKVGDYVFASSSASAEVNSMWIAQNDNISSSVQPKDDAANWVEFQAQRGEQGPAGRDGMQVEGTEGQTLVHNGTTWVATDQLSVKKLDVTGKSTSSGEALFEVKDKDGNVVFAVYPDGVCVYVDESKSADKVRSGLVVTSRPATKDGTPQDYLVVNTNGTQVIVDQDESKVRSGLIVTKRPATKGEEAQDYLVVNPNGTQVIVDQNDSKVRSGLIVTKRPATKGEEAQDYLVVNPNGTQVIVDQNDSKVRSGLIVTKRPATKGEEAQDYLVVNPNGTQVIVDQNDSKVRSGLIVTKRPATKGEEAQDYLVVNPNGTQVIVDQNDSKVRSGLIVTKRPATKGEEAQDYLVVNPNGTQVIVDQNDSKVRSGLIVTKRPATKGEDAQDYLVVNPNGTQVIVDDELEGDTKANRSGFVVTSRPATKDDSPVNYLKVATDGTKISFDENSSKAKRSGIIVTSRPATKDGEDEVEYMTINTDSTRFYINGGSGAKGNFGVDGRSGDGSKTGDSNGGFAVSGRDGSKGTAASNLFNIDLATDAKTLNNENRVYWYPEKNAFMAGNLKVDHKDSVGTNSFNAGYQNKAIGQYSQAMGFESRAKGDFTTAVGRKANAVAERSYALGDSAQAKGKGSYAFGRGAVATGEGSYALGGPGAYKYANITIDLPSPRATGQYAYALGAGTEASGFGSLAIGVGCQATGIFCSAIGYKDTASNGYSFALGYETKAKGAYSTTMGYKTKASGIGSTAMGYETTTSDNYSTAIGYYSKALKQYSYAIGYKDSASADYSFALGYETKAKESYSTALGYQTTAKGYYSTVLGNNTTATGSSSTAMGYKTKASGTGSLAMGYETTADGYMVATTMGYRTKASGWYSTAIGSNTTAYSYAETAVGQWNTVYKPTKTAEWNENDRLFVIGNGYTKKTGNTTDTIKSDALIVYKNGKSVFSGNIIPKGDIIPNESGTSSLGNSDFKWKQVYTQTLSVSGKVSSSLIPVAFAPDLGSTDARWGHIYLNNSPNVTSDKRLKTNIKPLEKALDKVLTLNGVTYEWRVKEFPDKNFDSKTHVGVLAQEVEAVLPEAVETGEDGYKSVKYSEITPLLIEAVKELKAEKDNLQATVESQQQQIDEMKRLVEELLKK